MNYKIYCCYHKEIFPNVYGNQFDVPIFVKLGDCRADIIPPRVLDLSQFETFVPMGRHFAETELLVNLYRAHMAGLYDLPEFVGFIHYDMSWIRRGDEKTIPDFLDQQNLSVEDGVMFQPFDGSSILRQPSQFGLPIALTLCKELTGYRPSDSELEKSRLALCNSYLLHKDVFLAMSSVLVRACQNDKVLESDKAQRIAGAITERIAALYLSMVGLNWKEFVLTHNFTTGRGQEKR